MNKFLLLICITFAYLAHTNANTLQQKPAPAKPAAAPKGMPPYVLKKDYEPQVQEMNAKISGAVNSTAALKRSIGEKFEKVSILDSQMQNVEKILNSASFQIALTSDSLKETRFSMEEFKKNTDNNIAELRTSDSELKNFLYIFFGAALLVSIILFIVIFMMMNSKLKEMKNTFQQQSKEFQMNLSDKMTKHETALSDDINSTKNRIQYDLNSMKEEMTSQFNTENEALLSQIKALSKKITDLENSKKNEA